MCFVSKGTNTAGTSYGHTYQVQLVTSLGFDNRSVNNMAYYGITGERLHSVSTNMPTSYRGNYLHAFAVADSETTIDYSGYIQFLAESWDWGGTDAYIYCAAVYKKDNREALKVGLGLDNTGLSNLENMDSATWSNILSNEDKVNYLLNSVAGDIMFKASGNTEIRTLIKNSSYASAFANNTNWGKILSVCYNYLDI